MTAVVEGGLTPLPDGMMAAVVTYLDMRERPRPSPVPDAPLSLKRWDRPEPARYRVLFARVGAPWLWFSRLVLPEQELAAIIHDPGVVVHAVCDRRGIEVGMLELDFRTAGQCEIAYFGLIPALAGRGYGRWLMAQALALGWRADVARMWVHTCTLDHPGALGFYRAQGFVPYARAIETFPDPRRTGHLPPDAARREPLIG